MALSRLLAAPAGNIVSFSQSEFVGGQSATLTVGATNSSTATYDFAVRFIQVPTGWTLATDTIYPLWGWNYNRTDGIAPSATAEFKPFYVTPPAVGGTGQITWELWQVDTEFGFTSFVQKLDTVQQSVSASGTPSPFALLLPAAGSTTQPPTPEFQWQAATNAVGYLLEIEGSILGQRNPLDEIVSVSLGTVTNWAYSGTPALACASTYWWRVSATNASGSTVNNGSWQWFTVTAPDPFGLSAVDVAGLFPQLQCINRDVSALTDFAYTLEHGLTNLSGALLTTNASQVLVLIHGWNPSPLIGPATFDPFNEVPWQAVVTNLTQSPTFTTNWTVVAYNWAHDANVGTVPTAETARPVGPADVGGIPLIGSATDAAERGYQHGLLIGSKLLEQVGTNNLKQVHLCAHSAGSWALYTASRYLRANGPPKLQVQVTYLDPFIPAQACFNSSHPFTPDLLQSSTNYASVTVSGAVAADGYWATVDDVTDYAACGSTTIHWSWPSPNSATFKVDNTTYGQNNWYAHDGPVKFYAATIADPAIGAASGYGWKKSLMYNEYHNVSTESLTMTAMYLAACDCLRLEVTGTPGTLRLYSGTTLDGLTTSELVQIPESGRLQHEVPVTTSNMQFFRLVPTEE
ncbi:MAG TPA: hypothetical protein PLX89_06460 [Verrucomicrobiota bacterium]|nr:hypothetical protein [Verrucomicrobiales bacterium]HRI12633.1 hypothetical protein [Verrucomicrobiota bacterium]